MWRLLFLLLAGTGCGGPAAPCVALTNLCDRVSKPVVEETFNLPAGTVTANPVDDELSGGPINKCDYTARDFSLTLDHWCFTRGADWAHQTFLDDRSALKNLSSVIVDVTGLGEEAVWGYSRGASLDVEGAALYSRSGNLVVAVGAYSQKTGTGASVSPELAQQRATAAVQKLLTAAGK